MDSIVASLNSIEYNENVSARECTTFRAGGNIRLVVCPRSADELSFCMKLFAGTGTEYCFLGNGSDILVPDEGFSGAMISTKNMTEMTCSGNTVTSLCGARLSSLVGFAHDNGLVGLEFAGGIPGTVGGGIFMNAGAYDGELSLFIKEVKTADEAGHISTLGVGELDMSYRHSIFMEKKLAVISGTFALMRGDVEAAREKVRELNARRRDKQPLEFASAGSTFKRPAGHFAGALIEEAGMKGFSIGEAQVSEKHAGFVINRGGATAEDIISVIRAVRKAVYEKTGIMLEPEVRLIGGRF